MKFWLGDEYSGLKVEQLQWVVDTFSQDRYRFVDEGYFTFDKYVIFENEEDATAYRLRWSCP